MSAPYRIRRPKGGIVDVSRGDGQEFKFYLDRLMKMIPAEVISLYLVGNGFIPSNQTAIIIGWSLICLIGVIVIKAYGTADVQANLPPDWTHVAISSIAFMIWLYTLGGPFEVLGIAVPYIGSLLVLGWTFFVPIFYNGPIE